MQRPFAPGSRQAPDPFDQFLENEGYYRKHTARDSSCLFRVISEQIYDTQMHHLSIREKCIDYMRRNSYYFEKDVTKNINEYLDEMSKPKTYGTLLELRAMGYYYERNVILFEPFNLGTWIINEQDFKNTLRVFFTPEKHFDSVYTLEFIQNAAFCQSLSYEILYKHVFKLPDVSFAVEHMLHIQSFNENDKRLEYEGEYLKKITLRDSRIFEIDRPENTLCILDTYILCHFHNPNFAQFAETLQKNICSENNLYGKLGKGNMADSVLPDCYNSCVRQLLKMGITPFPYKVAKALDPDIYRNIEFDAWSEMRREDRFKNWYAGGNNFQVGVKCRVKLRKSQYELYTCHIQEMSDNKGPVLVYVEELGEKHIVPFENLEPLPFDQIKPWPLPFRYQKHLENFQSRNILNEIKKGRQNRRKLKEQATSCKFFAHSKSEKYYEHELSLTKHDATYKMKEFTAVQHFIPSKLEYITLPLNVEHGINSTQENCDGNNNNNNNNKNKNTCRSTENLGFSQASLHDVRKDDEGDDLLNNPERYVYNSTYPEQYYTYPYEGNMISSSTNGYMPSYGPLWYIYNGQVYSTQNASAPQNYYLPSAACFQQQQQQQQQQQNSYIYPGAAYYPVNISTNSTVQTPNNGNLNPTQAYYRRPSNITARINFLAGPSVLKSGSDLPADIPTLRFFYNLGNNLYHRKAAGSNLDNLHEYNENNLTKDLQSLKLETERTNTTQVKSDSNVNLNQNAQPRKYYTKTFSNKKDKPNVRNNIVNTSNRFMNTEFSKPVKNTPNMEKPTIKKTIPAATIASDQNVQTTSPLSSTTLIDMMDMSQAIYAGSPQNVYPSNLSYYNNEHEQYHYIPMPFGMYHHGPPVAPPPQQTPVYPSYLVPPPPINVPPIHHLSGSYSQTSQPTYMANNVDTPTAFNPETNDTGGPFTVMGYSPVFYSQTANNCSNSKIPSANGGPQAYWLPGPPQIQLSNSTTLPNNAGGTNLAATQKDGVCSTTTNNISR